jgi:hypothetical protein
MKIKEKHRLEIMRFGNMLGSGNAEWSLLSRLDKAFDEIEKMNEIIIKLEKENEKLLKVLMGDI